MKWTFVLGPVLGLVVIGGLVYWTWCWGLWGRGNLLLQALFQCRCPAVSEQARYKPFKVMSSACAEPYLKGFSPSGRYVLLSEQHPQQRAIRLDMLTGETLDISFTTGNPFFLTDDLLLTAYSPDDLYFVVDLTDKVATQVTPAESLDAALVKLREADRVWVTNDQFSYPYVIGIVDDYKYNTQGNVALKWQGKKQELLDKLNEGGVKYDIIPPYIRGHSPPYDFYSLDEQLYADRKGIYLVRTGQLIVANSQEHRTATTVGPAGWVLDNHAVVYGMGGRVSLVGGNIFLPTLVDVPQPILLLEVPPQYWATPTPEP
jgi:hypothetical protein